MRLLWGIDLGGTKIEGLVCETGPHYRPLIRHRIPTEKSKGYQHILDRIQALVRYLAEQTGHSPTGLGIGTPGALDPDSQTLKNSNTTCLIGQPIKRDLEQRLGVPIWMANDANCFALAETKLGSVSVHLPNAEAVFGIIMGTGVGGGVVINGQVLNGRHSIGGEWGHNFLHESGGLCYCGKVGCVETILSGPALEKFYLEASGIPLGLAEIYQQHLSGTDKVATRTLNRLVHFFGKGLASVVNILDPDAIVVGGGVGNIELLYTAGRDALAAEVFNPSLETLLLPPRLGDSAGVFGAAMLAERA